MIRSMSIREREAGAPARRRRRSSWRLARRPILWAAPLALALAGGCVPYGANAIRTDRIGYNHAVADSWKEQLLLNLLRLRYGDAPVFLDVVSIRTEYKFERSASLSPLIEFGGDGEIGFGGRLRVQDEPRVSYRPLQGRELIDRLMVPIRPESVSYLAESGWDLETLLVLCTDRIGGVVNNAGSREAFDRLSGAIADAAGRGDLRFRVSPDAPDRRFTLELSGDGPSVGQIRETLGLDPSVTSYRLTGDQSRDPSRVITLRMRSVMGVMETVAHGLDIPESHIEEGRATPGDAAAGSRPTIALRHAPEPPVTSFSAVDYLETWYWIGDDDLASKRVFSLLHQLIALQGDTPAD